MASDTFIHQYIIHLLSNILNQCIQIQSTNQCSTISDVLHCCTLLEYFHVRHVQSRQQAGQQETRVFTMEDNAPSVGEQVGQAGLNSCWVDEEAGKRVGGEEGECGISGKDWHLVGGLRMTGS